MEKEFQNDRAVLVEVFFKAINLLKTLLPNIVIVLVNSMDSGDVFTHNILGVHAGD